MCTAIKHPVPDRVKPVGAERQSARMSKITYDGLTLSGTCFITVPIIMATVGVKGLNVKCVIIIICELDYRYCSLVVIKFVFTLYIPCLGLALLYLVILSTCCCICGT